MFGAVTKAYLDWRADGSASSAEFGTPERKRRMKLLFIGFIANSIFALFAGSHIACLFVTLLPEWSAFGKAVAYLSGAVAINVLAGLLAINWKNVILSKIRYKDED